MDKKLFDELKKYAKDIFGYDIVNVESEKAIIH